MTTLPIQAESRKPEQPLPIVEVKIGSFGATFIWHPKGWMSEGEHEACQELLSSFGTSAGAATGPTIYTESEISFMLRRAFAQASIASRKVVPPEPDPTLTPWLLSPLVTTKLS